MIKFCISSVIKMSYSRSCRSVHLSLAFYPGLFITNILCQAITEITQTLKLHQATLSLVPG
jgi:hypothetical protein